MTDKTRDERIREYAYYWYEFRKLHGRLGTKEQDWEKARHIVDSEDRYGDMVRNNNDNGSVDNVRSDA